MEPTVVVHGKSHGIESVEIQAGSETEQKAAEEILERIRPCLDVAEAILKRTSTEPRG